MEIFSDIKKIASDERRANIPLHHLIFGCEFRESCLANLWAIVSYLMMARNPAIADAINQVWVWHLNTINLHEIVTVDYGGAYWLNAKQLDRRSIRHIHNTSDSGTLHQ